MSWVSRLKRLVAGEKKKKKQPPRSMKETREKQKKTLRGGLTEEEINRLKGKK